MSKKITHEEVLQRLKNSHGDSVKIDLSTYKNTHSKARFIDSEFGEWFANAKNVLGGEKHPKKAIKERSLKREEIEKRIRLFHGDTVTLIWETYSLIHNKCTFNDVKYGNWVAKPVNVMSGSKNPLRSFEERRIPFGALQKRVELVHGSTVSLVEKTYKGYRKKCKFFDIDFGEWETYPSAVLSGSGHPQRGVLKQNNSFKLQHWESGRTVSAKASYEKAVVEFLNTNKIRYEWQPKVFIMPSGKKYTPDLFLTDKNIWIEIKGYFRDDAFEKWEWFSKAFPNCELWDSKKLKSMGII